MKREGASETFVLHFAKSALNMHNPRFDLMKSAHKFCILLESGIYIRYNKYG